MRPVLESIQLGINQSVSAFNYNRPDFDVPWHFHPQHELTYIEESKGTKFVGDFVGPYQPGELVLVRSNVPHCWKNNRDAPGSARSVVVHWNQGIFTRLPEFEKLFILLDQAAHGVQFDDEQVAPFRAQILQLPTLSDQRIYIHLLQLLSDLSLCDYRRLSHKQFIDGVPKEFSRRITKIHDFVEKEFHRKIYLKEISDHVNMSEQSFSRFFSRMMGRSFFTFLNEYRINTATRMLIDTGRSVSDIGYACGYDSLPFFHKQFRKYQGTSPFRYRNSYL